MQKIIFDNEEKEEIKKYSNKYSKEHWIKLFQSLLNKLYNYKYSENQEVILNLNK